MADLETAGAVVGIAAGGLAVLTGAGAAVRWAWRANRKVVRVFDAILGDGTPHHPGIVAQVDAIRGEVTLNSGRSMKDEVVRTREAVDAMRGIVDGHLAWHLNSDAVDPTVSLTHPGRTRPSSSR